MPCASGFWRPAREERLEHRDQLNRDACAQTEDAQQPKGNGSAGVEHREVGEEDVCRVEDVDQSLDEDQVQEDREEEEDEGCGKGRDETGPERESGDRQQMVYPDGEPGAPAETCPEEQAQEDEGETEGADGQPEDTEPLQVEANGRGLRDPRRVLRKQQDGDDDQEPEGAPAFEVEVLEGLEEIGRRKQRCCQVAEKASEALLVPVDPGDEIEADEKDTEEVQQEAEAE